MMEANFYENEFKVKEINSHLRSWENVKEIINGNFLGTFFASNHFDFRVAFAIFNNVYCANLKDGFNKNNLQNVISVLEASPTFNMFLLHKNIGFSNLLSNLSESTIPERKLVEELSSYFTFHINFCLENRQNLCGLYEHCFNLQGQTDFLINFLKATTLNEDFPRAQEYADNETKRVITVSQLAVFYEHSWLNSSVPPDKETCEFYSRFDSLLTKKQSDKFSYINNADVDKLTKKEKKIREQFSSSNFRNMVNEYQKSTFQELKDYVEIKNDEIIIKCYPDRNRFQMIMYSPDEDLSLQERYIKYAFFQKAVEKDSKWIKEFINSLEKPKQIEMPEELQNMMQIIDGANFNYEIKDDIIYDNFLNQFFEKFVSQDQILQDILNGNCVEDTENFKNIMKILLKNYDEEKKKNIILELLSSKSKLRVDFKAKLLFENLELLKDKDSQFVEIFPNDDFLNELYSGNLNNIYFVTIIEVIFFKFPIEENSDKIIDLLSLQSKLSYETKECLLYNFLKRKLRMKENFNLLDVVNDERLSTKEKNLILVYEKDSGFLKSCYKGEITEEDFENSEEFLQALYFKLNLYSPNTQMKILKLLLSEKSKLPDDIKQSLQINYFELIPGSIKMLARDELPLNKKTLFKFYKKLFFICKNDPKKIFNLLQKIVNDDKTIPELKKIIYQNVNRVLYLFTGDKSDRQKIFQDILNTLPNENDFDYSNEFKCAVKPLKENFNKLVFESKKDENFIPQLIDDEFNHTIKV